MFRDSDIIYYNSKGFGGKHDLDKKRKEKGSKKSKEIKNEITSLKEKIKRISKLLNKKDNSIEKEYSFKNSLKKANEDLLFWELELNKLLENNLPQHKNLKTKTKKIPRDKLKKQILEIIDESVKNNNFHITKEDVALRLQVKIKFVEQIFMELNREGKLSQASHKALHDSNRDPWGFENNKGWASDIYYINK